MKPTLADQVRKFMEARDGRPALTPTQMAALVAKQQTDLRADQRCQRQNIEQLLDKNFKAPRYMPALAKAMGTSVEVLAAGRFVPGEALLDSANEEALTIEGAFDLISTALIAHDKDSRRHILEAIDLYCRNPKAGDGHRRYVIGALMGGAPKIAVNE